MALQYVKDAYQSFKSGGDPRTDNWLLIHEPFYIACLAAAYIFIVIKGPKWMEHREPFNLRKPLIAYNFLLVGLSGWMMYEYVVTTLLNPSFNFWCQPIDPKDTSDIQMRQLNVTWWYFISKIIEFSDTFFFIMRKKNNQISFLHIYHHSSVLVLQWSCTKWVPGSTGCFVAMFNCFIHVLMYGYYMLAAFGPHMQKYLWWKRHLTRVQMFQFLIVFLHTSYAMKLDCGYPKRFMQLLWFYMLSLFLLFSHFYTRAYNAKKEDKKAV